MKARILVLLAILVLFVAFEASAGTCFKCREQSCFMAEGTASWCKGITNGCFSGGTCTGSSCGDRCAENPVSELREPLVNEWMLVAIAVESEKTPDVRLATIDTPRPADNPIQ